MNVARLLIRPEEPGDEPEIDRLHRAAFGGELEARLVRRLREEGELLVSLVAQKERGLIGHIAIAAAGIAEHLEARLGWLAPVGVRPERQRQSIGSRLVEAALDEARAAPLDAVVVLGAPAYYGRFGFSADAAKALASRFSGPALQLLPFSAKPLSGALIEPRAFALFD